MRVVPKTGGEHPSPIGVWFVVEQGPDHGSWWIKATDLEAKAWVSQHPGDTVSGCWLAPGRRLKALYMQEKI